MRCPYCHNSLDANANFCKHCGQPITPPRKSAQKAPDAKPPKTTDAKPRLYRTLKTVLTVLLVLLVAAIAFVALVYTGVIDLGQTPRIVEGESTSVVRISFDAEDDASHAVVTAYDDEDNVVWDYETPSCDPDSVSELGWRNDRYYFLQGGSVLALDAQSGKTEWENDDFGSSGTDFVFGDDGIYICSKKGPDFFAVDYDGQTQSLIIHLSDNDAHAEKIELKDGQIQITLRDENGDLHIIQIDPNGFEPSEVPTEDESETSETESDEADPTAETKRLVRVVTNSDDITYTYDAEGRLAEKVSEHRHYVYEYDEAGRLVSKKQPDSDYNGEDAIEREYNAAGQLVQENRYGIIDMWRESTYTYGEDGRIATEDIYSIDPYIDLDISGGCAYSYSTDDAGYLTETRTGTYGSDYGGVYIYDEQGRLVQGTDEYWLTQVEYSYEADSGSWRVYTKYLPTIDEESYIYAHICRYDAAGAPIEEVWLGVGDGDDSFSFTYDDDGYLIAVDCGDQHAELFYADVDSDTNAADTDSQSSDLVSLALYIPVLCGCSSDCTYALYDMDLDDLPELIVFDGFATYSVYTIESYAAQYCGEVISTYSDCLYACPDGGLLLHDGGMGSMRLEYVFRYTVENGSLSDAETVIGTEECSFDELYAYLGEQTQIPVTHSVTDTAPLYAW